MFELKFETDNACFEDHLATEASAIIREVAMRVSQGRTAGKVMDSNGNTVGSWTLTKE